MFETVIEELGGSETSLERESLSELGHVARLTHAEINSRALLIAKIAIDREFEAESAYHVALLRTDEKTAEKREAWAKQASSSERYAAQQARAIAEAWRRAESFKRAREGRHGDD